MPGRVLQLLALLQARGRWSAGELSSRLGVSSRTLRRDVERLRSLDYPVRSLTGPDGGYSLGEGAVLPPLQLSDDEAVAIAVALASHRGNGSGDGLDSARIKLERLLPVRLRSRYRSLAAAIDTGPGPTEDRFSDAQVLLALADAVTARRQVAFVHEKDDGRRAVRTVQPHRLATLSGRWYLVGFDCDRDDWRSFRVNRIASVTVGHHRFEPTDIDAVDFLRRSFAAARYRYGVAITFGISAEELLERHYGPIYGQVIDRPDGGCEVSMSADSLDLVSQMIGGLITLDLDVSITGDPEVLERLKSMRRRISV